MTKKRRNIIILVCVAAAIAAMLIANLGLDRRDRTDVTVESIEVGTLVARVSGPGRVRAETTVQISSSLMGRVTELGVDEGDEVDRGQFLLRLDDVYYASQVDQARANVQRSKAQLASAERDLSDIDKQFEKGLVSEKEKSDITASATTYRQNHREALARLKAAKDQLDKTVFHSPIGGVVTRLNIEEGENVVTGTMNAAGTVIMTISDMANMEVEVEIDETDIVDVEIGQTAEITVEALVDTVLKGHVTEVGNSGITAMAGTQEEVTNFLVTVLVDDPHGALRPGMTATVEITTAEHVDVLNVPVQSVVSRLPSELEKSDEDDDDAEKEEKRRSDREEEEEVEGVFVVDEGDVSRFVPVRSGIADELSLEVTGDLTEGQKVVSGPYKVLRTLKNGEDLKVEGEENSPETGD